MGEVYQATDTNLKRQVAIKVLPEAVATDSERLARFQREAEVLASLNHPNIAAIHGLERTDSQTALVMELVEGPTLADRIAQGPIPVDEALPIAKQIAEALEAAHEQGIIHRDLKPANVKVRPDGTVKVLDFGLAKAMESPGAASLNASLSPTITTPAMTQAGMILGTAAYMSPEQARGKPADKRADIWAFGCVLYEMLTGRRAFGDEDVSLTLSKVLQLEPDFDALAANVPPRVRQTLRVCLRKEPRQRASDIRDVRLALEGAFETATLQTAVPVGAPEPTGWHPVWILTASAMLVAAVSAASVWFAVRGADVLPRVSRLVVALVGENQVTINGLSRDIALTPDGAHLVYIGNNGTTLFVRALEALESVPVFAGTPRGPFVSSDGEWIGFADSAAGDVLKKVARTGGPAVTLAMLDGGLRGATWAPDGTVIFATSRQETGLQRIDATSAAPIVLTRPDSSQGELDHLWPEPLPGGRAVLFTITTAPQDLDAAQVAVLDLETGAQKVLFRGGAHAHYLPTGHLIYGAGGTLRAVRFDLARMETEGTSIPVVPAVATTGFGGVDTAVADDGTLVYVAGVSEAIAVCLSSFFPRRGARRGVHARSGSGPLGSGS